MNGKQAAVGWMIIALSGICIMFFLPGCRMSQLQYPAKPDVVHETSPARLCENPEQYYLRGRHLQDRQKHGLALEEFKAAITRDPDFVDAYNAMGISLDASGMHLKAIRAYNQALERSPGRADILNNLAYSHLLQGNSDSAVKFSSQAVALDPDNKRYLNNLGIAHVEAGDFDEALKEFRKTAETSMQARMRLAGLLYRKGHVNEARQHELLANSLKDIIRPSLEFHDKHVPTPPADETIKKEGGTALQKNEDHPSADPEKKERKLSADSSVFK